MTGDGTVVWETPGGWAAGRRLVEFVHAESRVELQSALSSVALGLQDRAELRCPVLDETGSWHPADVTVVATPGLEAGRTSAILVAIHPARPAVPERASLARIESVDDLTALGDRTALSARLAAAERGDEKSLAVLYLDVDHFKLVNDHLGHAAGDRVLVAVADRLRETVRPGDLVTRIGGDEFVIVAGGVGGDTQAMEIAERIRANVAEPIPMGGRRVNATVSIGVVVGIGAMASVLLEQADAALYRAKDLGRNQSQMYQAADRLMRHRATGPEELLRSALDDGLVVVYEPVVSLVTERVTTLEASLRLRGDEGQLGPPDALLRLAEKSGLVVSLGAGMLDLACREVASWSALASDPPGLTWPISARQLEEPRAADQVLAILRSHGLEPARLVLEVAEGSLAEPPAAARQNVEDLQSSGVRLAAGSFGSGSGGLALLMRYSYDILTLDPEFMAGFGDNRRSDDVVAAILGLARNLGMQTVATGVRTRAQLELLRFMGCDAAQGPVMGPALSAEELRARALSQAPAWGGTSSD